MKIKKTLDWVINKYIIKWIQFEASVINMEVMSLIKCHYLASMTNIHENGITIYAYGHYKIY